VLRNLALLAAAPLFAVAIPAPARADGWAPGPLPTAAPAAAGLAAVPAATLMSQVVTITNQVREANGCGQLDVDQELIAASQRQSIYMAETGRLSHLGWGGSTFITRARLAGYQQPASENIAWGYHSAQEVVDAWMASPGHRANILNCETRSIGTGVSYSFDGTPYYTQVFGWQ
jgi:uncharacterized protein YkwD